MKWKVTFLDGSPDEEVEADSWVPEHAWLHFYRNTDGEALVVASYRADAVRAVKLMPQVEGEAKVLS